LRKQPLYLRRPLSRCRDFAIKGIFRRGKRS